MRRQAGELLPRLSTNSAAHIGTYALPVEPHILPDMGGVSASWVGMAPVVGDFGSGGLPILGWRWRFGFFEEV